MVRILAGQGCFFFFLFHLFAAFLASSHKRFNEAVNMNLS